MKHTFRVMIALMLFCVFLCVGILIAAGVAVSCSFVGLSVLTYPIFGMGLMLNLPASIVLAGDVAKRLVKISA